MFTKLWVIMNLAVIWYSVQRCAQILTVIVQVFGTNVMVTVAKSFEAPIKCKKHIVFSPSR